MSIRILAGLSADGQLYYDEEMGITEAMLPTGGWPTAHAPALLETRNGTMLCCWFAGTYEGGADINIVVSRLPKGADRWEEPIHISNENDFSNQNPSLFLAPHGEIWCMYTSQLGRQPGKDNMQFTSVIKRQISIDDGRTWGDPEIVFPEKGTFARQPIQILASGRWIFSNWLCTDSAEGLSGDPTVFRVSDDEGKTWNTVDVPHSAGRVHANVIELEDGHLIAFMRSREADWIYKSESYDDGDTWTKPEPTELPNNNSSISALKLTSGRIAIAYNHSSAPKSYTKKGAWPGLRCPVSIALSEDGGKTFPFIRNMERGEGFVGRENRANNRQYEYPYLMQSRDGMLHLAYAYQTRRGIKWATFGEEDVMGKIRGTSVYNPTSGEVEG
ncbi:sialidase family protein [Hominifimenecus sp. rT4P-3]|uniref:sialidase family protein n=1 Tax=Hominifimenecus sp. rT4P-3 TaxID=3242979 RepID=UPI003DA6327F